jgi:hypothetical protein
MLAPHMQHCAAHLLAFALILDTPSPASASSIELQHQKILFLSFPLICDELMTQFAIPWCTRISIHIWQHVGLLWNAARTLSPLTSTMSINKTYLSPIKQQLQCLSRRAGIEEGRDLNIFILFKTCLQPIIDLLIVPYQESHLSPC